MKRRKKRRWKSIIVVLALLILIPSIIKKGEDFIEGIVSQKESAALNSHEKNKEVLPMNLAKDGYDIDSSGLTSKHAILVRLGDNKILMDKGSENKIYPASLTKMMTCLVAIEHIDDLHQSMVLSNSVPISVFDSLYAQNASMAGFGANEEVTPMDLLYGVMLPSGAECCIGLSNYIAGSEEAFVDMMNEKSRELGMEDTHFTNSTGLQDKNHYTTVKDLSILLEYALKNETFKTIFTSSKYLTSSVNNRRMTFYSTLFKSMENNQVEGGMILGGKTGYTSEAQLCLASLARINEEDYILVSAKAKGNHQTEQFHIKDAFYIYNQINEKVR